MITSKRTARAMVPAVMRLVTKAGLWERGTFNLDVGGGPYELLTQALWREHRIANLVWDPHNRDAEHNARILYGIERCPADTCTISNVLNVIPSKKERLKVLKFARKHTKPGGLVFITVYEGDRDGVGQRTRDGWQEHRRTRTYVEEISGMFPELKVEGRLIIARVPPEHHHE